jgi:hypothetical protein
MPGCRLKRAASRLVSPGAKHGRGQQNGDVVCLGFLKNCVLYSRRPWRRVFRTGIHSSCPAVSRICAAELRALRAIESEHEKGRNQPCHGAAARSSNNAASGRRRRPSIRRCPPSIRQAGRARWELLRSCEDRRPAGRRLRRGRGTRGGSNAAVDLVHAGKLEEAEQAGCDLRVRFPDAHDGYDRLGIGLGPRRQQAGRHMEDRGPMSDTLAPMPAPGRRPTFALS